jgi:uncharacterized membrane protein SpoIIM required for sporulation
MFELLINPKNAESRPWEMFFVGVVYATIAVLLPYFIFGQDYVNSKYLSWISIMFLVILTLPYIYYTLRLEERKDSIYDGSFKLLREHGKAIAAFMWLFLGFVVAFSILYMVLPNADNLFKAQIEVFCQINRQADFANCLNQYGVTQKESITGAVTSGFVRVLGIFSNNVQVLILTLIFSLILGAGAIFILAWNASVIAAAIKIFVSSDVSKIGLGLGRYMIHGIPEIAAYFVGALAGGILSLSIIRKETAGERFWIIVQDVIFLILIALLILFGSALIEVFITPKLF